ncbi:hypothetical protein N4P33_03200 [Streptomyces sp. 15-116A]|uniref:hypothetical protein n=1 Tax=Streptomyces sp. 15-116A TaxID=2259035 RepID=UPI0021B402B8|nr:hypothetical protein [Streptomyces sp. 15-116A]MCT7351177.1 hypothetical protein [Streptomyces sp. 15-116A]
MSSPLMIRRTCVAAGLLALVVTGCGSGSSSGAVPEGWGTLTTKGVSVAYPEGFEEQGAGERSKHNAAAAELREGGRRIALITVQLGFTEANSAEQAAIAAEAGIQMGAKVEGTEDVELTGTDDARRIDFTFEATGEGGGPAKGAEVEGVILTGLDSSQETFAVRIDAQEGKVSGADLERIVESVEVR